MSAILQFFVVFVLLCVYDYIIYCNTVYVKRISKYFIKNKNKSPHKWDRTVPEVSRRCPPWESGKR
nr:MAG TPA: hypothetical protein [Caudoviricetes sp.]